MSVTTRLVKSPKSIYVINKMIFLTPNSLVQVKPEDILVMSRPYGPAKVSDHGTNVGVGTWCLRLFGARGRRRDIFLNHIR